MASQRAVIYARISEDRTGAGLGIQRQLEDCRALARSRGLIVAQEFTDNDTSAYSGKLRPGYRAMLSAIEGGEVEVVLAWHTDRLHRNNVELEEYIACSERSNTTTLTVKAGKLDLSTASGRMTARILGAVARQESEHKAERIRRKAEEIALAGKWTGGSRPFGWRIVDRVPVIDEAEAAIIRDAHAHVLAGLSLGSFIQSLNAQGVTTARGGTWSYATLRQMLLRPRNAGLTEWKGQIVGLSEFQPIVERHVWEATRSYLTNPDRRRSTTNKVRHLLSGIALCECLQPVKSGQIVDRQGVKHTIYRCSESGPGHVNKRMSYVDEHVERHVLYFLTKAAHSVATPPRDAQVLTDLRTDEAAYRERLNEAGRLFVNGTIDGEQLAEVTKGLKAKLTTVQQKLAEHDQAEAERTRVSMPAEIDWSDPESAEWWRSLHIERKRAWIRNTFEIVLHRHSRGSARVFDPGTVQIIHKSTPDVLGTPAIVEQWRQEHANWDDALPYGMMVAPSAPRNP